MTIKVVITITNYQIVLTHRIKYEPIVYYRTKIKAYNLVGEVMLAQKKWLVNFLITLYLIFFSLPMILVSGFPWSYKWYYMYGIEYLVGLLGALIVISPWALLLMAIICYKKELKLQTYVATALFFWAAITELFVILFYLILEHPPLWYGIPH